MGFTCRIEPVATEEERNCKESNTLQGRRLFNLLKSNHCRDWPAGLLQSTDTAAHLQDLHSLTAKNILLQSRSRIQ